MGKAMINAAVYGYEKQILEVKDINLLAKRHSSPLRQIFHCNKTGHFPFGYREQFILFVDNFS